MILVIGQNAAWQRVYLLPRFAHGEVNRIDTVMLFASSKGPNVAAALGALGGDAEVLGYAGGAHGRRLRESLQAEGIRARWVRIGAETRSCMTFVEPGGIATEAIEPAPPVTPAERAELRRLFDLRIRAARVLVIAGTPAAGETRSCYAAFVRAARRQRVVTILDASGPAASEALAAGPEILKVNERELAELAGMPTGTRPGRLRACRSLAWRFGIRWFFVSRGAEGMEGFNGTLALRAAAPAAQIRNPIGAGDAATAGIAWTVHGMLGRQEPADVFASRACLQQALGEAAAMGTASCLSLMNGRVERRDYLRVRKEVSVTEIPLP